MADVNAEGQERIVVTSATSDDPKLYTYDASMTTYSVKMQDRPTAITSFYHSSRDPTPSLAVAAGQHVYIYRHMRPYLKYTLPPMEFNPLERDIWEQAKAAGVEPREIAATLQQIHDGGASLSHRATDFLSLNDEEELMREFLRNVANEPFSQYSAITCMSTIAVKEEDDNAPADLVIGTEDCRLIIIDQETMNAKQSSSMQEHGRRGFELESVPAFLWTSGRLEVSWRIIVACRDGRVYSFKDGRMTNTQIELETSPVGLVGMTKNPTIYLATMEKAIHCFHIKGKKYFTKVMPADIVCMEKFYYKQNPEAEGLLVALKNGEIRLLNGKAGELIHSITVQNEIVCGMRFGTCFRENMLAITFNSGAFMLKALSRIPDLTKPMENVGPPPEQDIPLPVPKKTKLYVEQTQREREQATDMHRTFQRDLCKMRLTTARSYSKLLGDACGPVASTGVTAQVRVNAEVRGLGPLFKILIRCTQVGQSAIQNTVIMVNFNPDMQTLVPNRPHVVECVVRARDGAEGSERIVVLVMKPDSVMPLVKAEVEMPVCDLPMAD